MNWLNKLDEVIDGAIHRRPTIEQEETEDELGLLQARDQDFVDYGSIGNGSSDDEDDGNDISEDINENNIYDMISVESKDDDDEVPLSKNWTPFSTQASAGGANNNGSNARTFPGRTVLKRNVPSIKQPLHMANDEPASGSGFVLTNEKDPGKPKLLKDVTKQSLQDNSTSIPKHYDRTVKASNSADGPWSDPTKFTQIKADNAAKVSEYTSNNTTKIVDDTAKANSPSKTVDVRIPTKDSSSTASIKQSFEKQLDRPTNEVVYTSTKQTIEPVGNKSAADETTFTNLEQEFKDTQTTLVNKDLKESPCSMDTDGGKSWVSFQDNFKKYKDNTNGDDEDEIHNALIDGISSFPTNNVHPKAVATPTLAPDDWIETAQLVPYDPSMNCHGIVRVRILQARHLPCSVGSAVQAFVSLRPWKGRMRTNKTRTFNANANKAENDHTFVDNGVCAKWDEDEASAFRMVHPYTGDETPIPQIYVELVFSPLSILKFSMSYLKLSCEPLFIQPLVPRKQWFMTKIKASDDKTIYASEAPTIQIEAVFEPTASHTNNIVSDPAHLLQDANRHHHGRFQHIGDHSFSDHVSASDHASVVSRSLHSTRREMEVVSNTSSHYLKLTTFYTPATCAVCRRNLMSTLRKVQAFRCESCRVDCCSGCRLVIDVELPCGSDVTRACIEKSIQHKLTAKRILEAVAPVVEENDVESINSFDNEELDSLPLDESEEGVGTLHLAFAQAHVFKESLPITEDLAKATEADIKKLRTGDYYIRVSRFGYDGSIRTPTVQNSTRPMFGSSMSFKIPHYGALFQVDLIDAIDERIIGSTSVPTQNFLQRHRDAQIDNFSFGYILKLLKGHTSLCKPFRFTFEFREGLDGVKPYARFPKIKSIDKIEQYGRITAVVDASVMVEENVERLYGDVPLKCGLRPPNEFHITILQTQLSRISRLITNIRELFNSYMFLISWKRPLLTLSSFIVSLYCCFYLHMTHAGCIPIFMLMAKMTHSAYLRHSKQFAEKYTRLELLKFRKAEEQEHTDGLVRPFGKVCVRVLEAKNIRSPENGLPGTVTCRAVWREPLHQGQRKAIKSGDADDNTNFEIAATEQVYSIDPVWKHMHESLLTKRLNNLIPSAGEFFASDNEKSIQFPVLQPVLGRTTRILTDWENLNASVVMLVTFSDTLSLIPGSEYTYGELSIPFQHLISQGKVEGWYPLVDSTQSNSQHIPESFKSDSTAPQIRIEVTWMPPVEITSRADTGHDTLREASLVVEEELSRAAVLHHEQKPNIIESSVTALNSVRGLTNQLAWIQNLLSNILDIIEAVQCIFNFADPIKSYCVLAGFFVLLIIFSIIPTRLIVTVSVVCQYTVTFIGKYKKPRNPSKQKITLDSSDKKSKPPAPYFTWLVNAFFSLPTIEDLRLTYYWDSRKLCALEKEKHEKRRRQERLERLWRAQWYNSIFILHHTDNESYWEEAFAVIQGRKFVWWPSIENFDAADEPKGHIMLKGHAGLATPSPLETKWIDKVELPLVVAIFGRGKENQERLTMLLPSEQEKFTFECALEQAIHNKAD